MQFFLFLALMLAIALVIFAVQNSAITPLIFLTWTFEGSFAFILAITFVVGMLSGVFIAIPSLWRKSSENRAQRKRIQELEGKLADSVD